MSLPAANGQSHVHCVSQAVSSGNRSARRVPPTLDHMLRSSAQEYNDTMLTVYMASVTKGLSALHDVIDKFNTAYDRFGPQRRRGGV